MMTEPLTVEGLAVDGKVEVSVTDGRVSRLLIDPYWRAETQDHQVRDALIVAVNGALEAYQAELEARFADVQPVTEPGASIRALAVEVGAAR